MDTVSTIQSPCIGVCELDLATDCCKGCYRSRAEVAAWSVAGDAEKTTILEAAAKRRQMAQQG